MILENTIYESTKHFGRIYTPLPVVDVMLDYVGYNSSEILQKHIVENSCGDGAFLCEIVQRYCRFFLEKSSDLSVLINELQTYIHGIEIDQEEHRRCLENLDKVASGFGLSGICWDVICADTLTQTQFDGKMDFVVGNPPYVRVHHLESSYENVKKYAFAQSGMTDLFIVFFEIGFQMMNKKGKMCLITPSSWLASRAGLGLRQYIQMRKNLSGVIDLEHFQPFEATTYTLISRFEQTSQTEIDYQTYDGKLHEKGTLSYGDFVINDNFYLATPEKLQSIRKIKQDIVHASVKVKNGYATLSDKVFIGDFPFENGTIKVVKASTGEWKTCIFPYDNKGRVLNENEFSKTDAYQYLLSQKETLEKRSIEKNGKWFQFGRSQAVNDTFKHKIAINQLVKDLKSIKINDVPKGCGVYGGLYILTDLSLQKIQEIVISDDFLSYLKTLKNYKSGGYYTFSSKDLELFINYKLQNDGQSVFSQNYSSLF